MLKLLERLVKTVLSYGSADYEKLSAETDLKEERHGKYVTADTCG
jgi:hypothetical protein